MEESLYSLRNEKKEIYYDFNDMENTSNNYYEKFIGLENLTEDDKINIWNDTIFKDGSVFGTQFIWRRLTGQGRMSLKTYLTDKFNDYGQLLEMILQAEKAIDVKNLDYEKIIKIMRINNKLIVKIIPGLLILRKNYVEDVFINLTGTINKILSNLDIFLEYYKICENEFIKNSYNNNETLLSEPISDMENIPLSHVLHPVVGTHSYHNPQIVDYLSNLHGLKQK